MRFVCVLCVYERRVRMYLLAYICVNMPLLEERFSIFVLSSFSHTRCICGRCTYTRILYCTVPHTIQTYCTICSVVSHSEPTHTHARVGKHKTRLQYIQSKYMHTLWLHTHTQTPISQPASQLASFSMDRCVDFEIFPHLSVLFVNQDSCVVYRKILSTVKMQGRKKYSHLRRIHDRKRIHDLFTNLPKSISGANSKVASILCK